MPLPSLAAASARAETSFDDVLHGGLHCVYQPFVDLDTGAVLAHESLLRGPTGTPWSSPLVLLDAARAAGLLVELELASLEISLGDAARQSPGGDITVFVNIEPSTLTGHVDAVVDAIARRPPNVQVVVEITERALAADLAGVLTGAERLRAAGCAIALDDVGVHPESLAFIPLLRPEVVKLDLRLLRTVRDVATLTVAGAVRTYAEESGAEVVAEGVETPADLTRALVLGATLGQGWHWGRGARAFVPSTPDLDRFAVRAAGTGALSTPYGVIERAGVPGRVRRTPKDLLVPLCVSLELMAMQTRVPPVLLASFDHVRFFTPRTADRFAELAARLPFVSAMAVDMPAEPAPGVRGTALSAADPLVGEWTVVVLGAHEAAALVARDLGGDPRADRDREFEFVVTHDRALVTAAAHALVGRLARR